MKITTIVVSLINTHKYESVSMLNFSFENPTKIHFGEQQIKEIQNEIPKPQGTGSEFTTDIKRYYE